MLSPKYSLFGYFKMGKNEPGGKFLLTFFESLFILNTQVNQVNIVRTVENISLLLLSFLAIN